MQFCVKRWLGWERGVAYVSLWILVKDDVGTVFLFALGCHFPIHRYHHPFQSISELPAWLLLRR